MEKNKNKRTGEVRGKLHGILLWALILFICIIYFLSELIFLKTNPGKIAKIK